MMLRVVDRPPVSFDDTRRYRAGEPPLKLVKQRFEEMMGAVPIVFGTFKLLVLAAGMYLAIKSHYDGEKKEKQKERERSAAAAVDTVNPQS
jgi:hypothetical protein